MSLGRGEVLEGERRQAAARRCDRVGRGSGHPRRVRDGHELKYGEERWRYSTEGDSRSADEEKGAAGL